jgi:hypothetical protein
MLVNYNDREIQQLDFSRNKTMQKKPNRIQLRI